MSRIPAALQNQWRLVNPDIKPDLSETDFSGETLSNAYLRDANLGHSKLIRVNLRHARLRNATLSGSNLTDAFFGEADLRGVDLTRAILSGATLGGANLSNADFNDALLNTTDISNANLSHANLSGCDLNKAICGLTLFTNVDLSTTKGLDTIRHNYPSSLGVETLFRSKGKIPEIFLRGCGVPETLITFLPSMMEEAIQFYSCFISYSHADKEFAKRLHDRLQGVGIRCWLDEYQLNPGDKLHPTIYEAIRVYDKVILCCSETALKSWWVEKEFENAVAKEEDYQETLLIPLSLDNYLFEQSADEWIIGEIRKKRLVQTFANWKDHDAFEQSFEKVVKALRTDGGKPPPPASKLTKRK